MDDNIKSLVAKYLEGKLTNDEMSWIISQMDIPAFREKVKEHFANYYRGKTYDDHQAFQIFLEKISDRDDNTFISIRRSRRTRRLLLRTAAVFIGVFLISYFLFIKQTEALDGEPPETTTNQVTLQLEDGTQILLDKSDNKVIKGNATAYNVVQKSGKLVYGQQNLKGKVVYNVLDVPLGQQFELQLSDGTQVYLNAGSQLRFPVNFRGQEIRQLELIGEAFFKVAPNKHSPFVVNSDGLSTEVFGTEFYISNYKDEASKVVLVEGSVGVFNAGKRYTNESGVLLSPSQLAILGENESNIKVEKVSTDRFTAWINGTLIFNNERFEDLIKRLERHYNVEFDLQYKALNNKRFTGKFDLEPIEEILKVFTRTNEFNYNIDNRKITITK